MKKDARSDVLKLLRKKVDQNLLASFLCLILDEAEKLFGPRLNPYPYMFTGIDYGLDVPQIRFSGIGKDKKNKYIFIRLNRLCKSDRKRALWQLIHESVHLLSPCFKNECIVLEEGMACLYQRQWVARFPTAFDAWAKTT